MTHRELPSLNDIYRVFKDPEAVQQTSYILQFLWRDLTSECRISLARLQWRINL